MGMDVYGKNATSETGEYFRNNVWWWHPLAEYLTETYPDITDACELWHTNDGDGLDANAASLLAVLVQRDLDNGYVEQYAKERQARLDALPRTTCEWCEGTGTRRDAVGVAQGMDVKGWCNACDGKGDRAHWDTNYPFSVENVAEFVAFLRDCGGFEIN